jgi:diacylglycerol kinase family enzyme
MVVFVNVASGAEKEADEMRRRLADALAAHGLEAEIRLVHGGDELPALAAAAVRDGAEVVVAGGGDGSVSAVAGALVGTPATLGVLPLGTLNHFARDLGIPLDLDEAVRVLATGLVAAVDVGEANGRVFVNNSSLGFYASLVHERERRQQQGYGKWLAMALAGIAVLRRLPFFTVQLSTGGHSLVRTTPLVFIGNNAYEMEGIEMGRRDRLDDGLLSVCVAHYDGVRGLVRVVASALFGRLREARDLDMLSVPELRVASRRKRLAVAFDGEVAWMEPPLHYRTRPRALRVIVPADEPAGASG